MVFSRGLYRTPVMRPPKLDVILSLLSVTLHNMVISSASAFSWNSKPSLNLYKLVILTTYRFYILSEANERDMIAGGALWGLVQISHDCSGEDIRTLACQTLTSSPAFRSELRRLKIKY